MAAWRRASVPAQERVIQCEDVFTGPVVVLFAKNLDCEDCVCKCVCLERAYL